MQTSPKARLTEITESLRLSMTPDAKMAVEMIRLCADAARDALVHAQGDTLLREQGKAQAFQRLHADLTVAPPTLKEKMNG